MVGLKPLALRSSVIPSRNWFSFGLLALFLASLLMRFWGLGRFNTLVFDEVYYAKFAYNYLTQTPFFDGHPPLSKYLIALSMAIGSRMPFGQEPVNAMVGASFAPWTYRWLNALMGACLPVLIAGLAYQIRCSRRYALIAGGLAFCDGLLLVESRYALNNVHLLLFGLLGLWAWLNAAKASVSHRGGWRVGIVWGWLGLAGVCFGCAAAIKWNGLWFLLTAYGTWLLVHGLQGLAPRFLQSQPAISQRYGVGRSLLRPLSQLPQARPSEVSAVAHLVQIRFWQVVGWLGVLPVATYIVLWIPHLRLNANLGFWQDFWNLQVEIFSYHQRVGSGPEVHRYCSNWLSWLVMARPVAYYYKLTDRGAPLPGDYAPPPITADPVIYDVHAMGNPLLWWFSTVAMVLVVLALVWAGLTYVLADGRGLWAGWSGAEQGGRWLRGVAFPPVERAMLLFLVVGYGANLLPWIPVKRCTFLYHYMGAGVFALLALAWVLDRCWRSSEAGWRRLGLVGLVLVAITFLFWLPIYLGLPLSPNQFRLRMWFPSWL
jgi:dolichyl-phosphate-mannose-protein mannosyltransferase